MKEVVFIRRNIEKWRKMEQVAAHAGSVGADTLADAYIDTTSDLAFAQSHYPNSRITLYLNNLASALHNEIYANKREKWTRLLTFWTREVPQTMYEARLCLLVSLAVFLLSALIGMVSQIHDAEFVRLILGDAYVDMTLENIARGEPMAVYDGSDETGMFLGITINNVYVSFIVFAMGIFTSIATGYMLFQNGVMLGCFLTMFYQHGLLADAMLAVWLHGTLEISAIIVAGAAGIAMGNGWLMPGTYPRLASFRRSAMRGLKIVVGTVPVFIVAAFIEGFFTRHTEWSAALRLSVIGLSLLFVVYYYIYLPNKRHNGKRNQKDYSLQGA
ncbi:MAG: stage II sporulation protein M [Prevotella sp.]|nr:stage II sporulation protein M [Prevotella sp.]